MFLAPRLGSRLGKRNAALVCGCASMMLSPMSVMLRLGGLLPPNHSPSIFPIVAGFGVVEQLFDISNKVLTTSMLADIVDDAEAQTGRRSEGVLFGAQTFAKKAVNGVGLLAAGLVLTLARFPQGGGAKVMAGSVEPLVVRRLGLLYSTCYFFTYALALCVLSTYQIDRATHEHNLAQVRKRNSRACRSASADPSELACVAEPISPKSK